MFEIVIFRECSSTVSTTLSLQYSLKFNILLQPSNALGPVYLND